MASSFAELEKEIESIREEYYSESGKNVVFKKQQKYDCAKQVVSHISIDVLLDRTCWIDEKTNYVMFDYPIMKTYASPEVFDAITDHIIGKFRVVKNVQGALVVILNLDGFTVSAAERYKSLIEMFCTKCFNLQMGFAQILTKLVISNAPSTIESVRPILMSFMLEEIKSKLQIVGKKDTAEVLRGMGVYPGLISTG